MTYTDTAETMADAESFERRLFGDFNPDDLAPDIGSCVMGDEQLAEYMREVESFDIPL